MTCSRQRSPTTLAATAALARKTAHCRAVTAAGAVLAGPESATPIPSPTGSPARRNQTRDMFENCSPSASMIGGAGLVHHAGDRPVDASIRRMDRNHPLVAHMVAVALDRPDDTRLVGMFSSLNFKDSPSVLSLRSARRCSPWSAPTGRHVRSASRTPRRPAVPAPCLSSSRTQRSRDRSAARTPSRRISRNAVSKIPVT